MKVSQEYLGHSREAMTDQTHVHLQDNIRGGGCRAALGQIDGDVGKRQSFSDLQPKDKIGAEFLCQHLCAIFVNGCGGGI